MSKFRQFFCKHNYEVSHAKFPLRTKIPKASSGGLTDLTEWNSKATNVKLFGLTIINTHYLWNVDRNTVYLFRKKCLKCGKIIPCDAFDAEEYINNYAYLLEAERELNERL